MVNFQDALNAAMQNPNSDKAIEFIRRVEGGQMNNEITAAGLDPAKFVVTKPVAGVKGGIKREQGAAERLNVTGDNIFSRAGDFMAKDVTTGAEAEGITGAIFQSTLGSKGAAGFGQEVGKTAMLGKTMGDIKTADQGFQASRQASDSADKLIAEAMKQTDPEMKRKMLKVAGDVIKGASQGSAMAKEGLAAAEKNIPSIGKIAGTAINTGLMAVPGAGAGSSLLTRVGVGAATGAAYAGANNLIENKPITEGMLTGAAIGGAIPLVGAALGKLKEAASKVYRNNVPALLSSTSNVPEGALKIVNERANTVVPKIKAGVTPEQVLAETQGGVRTMRDKLTQEWDEALPTVVSENAGKRIAITGRAEKLLNYVTEKFPQVEAIPQNIKNVSAKEYTNLITDINKLYNKKAVREAAEGLSVRALKDELEKMAFGVAGKGGKFGNAEGAMSKLYKNYSAGSAVMDAADDIVNAYETNQPTAMVTAVKKLQSVFDKDKGAYLQAILRLEEATGLDILGGIAATKVAQKAPSMTLTAAGGVTTKAGIVDGIIRTLGAPLTSPRAAGFFARHLPDGGKVAPATTLGKFVFGAEGTKKGIVEKAGEKLSKIKPGNIIEDVNLNNPAVGKTAGLLSEAKKYKSADEFVKAQGQTVYHGTSGDFELPTIEKAKSNGKYGAGIYLGEGEPPTAGSKFGNQTKEFILSPDANIKKLAGKEYSTNPAFQGRKEAMLDVVDIYKNNTGKNLSDVLGNKDLTKANILKTQPGKAYTLEQFWSQGNNKIIQEAKQMWVEELKKQGFNGINDRGDVVLFQDGLLKTKSQLTEIWNQANK